MRRYLVLPVIAAMLLTLGACGSSDESGTSTGDQPAARASSEDATTTTQGSSDDGDDDGGSGRRIPDLPAVMGSECQEVAALFGTVMAQSLVVMAPGADTAELERTAEQLDEARSKVPDEIADAFDTWSTAWSEFATEMEAINADGGLMNTANADRFEAAGDLIDTPEVEAASQEIEQYFEDACTIG